MKAPNPASLTITVGQYGGFYWRRGFTTRLCLGWVAFTWYPFDLDVLLSWLMKRVKDEPKEPTR